MHRKAKGKPLGVNNILADHGTWLEVDVSTKTHPNAVMKIDKADWKNLRSVYKGRAIAFSSGGRTRGLYAQCRVGKLHARVHRLICDTQFKDIDHINHDGLDNRKENLRGCTHGENMANQSMSSANTSGIKGVTWDKRKEKWQAQLAIHGKNHFLGYFSNKNDAGTARKAAEMEHFGAFTYQAKEAAL